MNGSWIKLGRIKRSDLPRHLRKKLPPGRRYQIAAFVPSDPEIVLPGGDDHEEADPRSWEARIPF